MLVEVRGTRLWFDVDGPAYVPAGAVLMERPTVILVHGGPGSYDHSYFKPYFARLAAEAQVVYLDLRDHGRSQRNVATDWSFEAGADDIRAFCDAVGITHPVVFGHSMGGCIAMLYGARHPGHASALVIQSSMARFDLERLTEGFRQVAGDDVAGLARRDYGGDPISDAEWAQVFAAFGPRVPTEQELARRIRNPELGEHGMELLRRFDVVDQLGAVSCPTLVCVGELDPVTPVAASVEIIQGLPDGLGQLAVIGGVGHFPWLDRADDYWPLLIAFVTRTGLRQ